MILFTGHICVHYFIPHHGAPFPAFPVVGYLLHGELLHTKWVNELGWTLNFICSKRAVKQIFDPPTLRAVALHDPTQARLTVLQLTGYYHILPFSHGFIVCSKMSYNVFLVVYFQRMTVYLWMTAESITRRVHSGTEHTATHLSKPDTRDAHSAI